MKSRNVIIGLDGIPFSLMDNFSSKNIMPNFKELRKQYDFLPLKSSIPHISSVSWSSIITGKNPGEHGIFGFTEIIENTYSLSYPNFNALKCKTFWQSNPHKQHVIINVPSTYPAKKVNGIHIAGFVALDLKKAVYPNEEIKELNEIGYEIDIDTKLAHQQSYEALFEELNRVLGIRKKTYQILWNKIQWDNFMIVITGTDRFGHFMWDTTNPNNDYYQNCLDFFGNIDMFIGEIHNKLTENDNLIILSDHGMEQINYNFNLNTFLEQEGYLKLNENLKNYNRIMKESKAFVLDPGRIYLNRKGKYPNGTVLESEEREVIKELKEKLMDLKFEGKNVIKKIHEKNEIYQGPYLENAPDLVILEESGFQPKGSIGKINLFEKDNFSGMHNDNAFILMNREISNKNPSVEDVIDFMV